MIRKLICITCPVGCRLEVDDQLKVSGNACPRGAVYARNELTDPRRTVTAVVATASPDRPYLPVRTSAPLPRALVAPLLNRLYRMRVELPVRTGDVLIADVEGSGVDVVFTADSDETAAPGR